jgi:gluconate 2-dehydrogenase gamma chain
MATTDRRQALFSLLAAIAAPELLASCVTSHNEDAIGKARALPGSTAFYTPDERRTVVLLADTIIPATDTPGALDADVPATLEALMTAWASEATKAAHRSAIAKVGARLIEIARKDLGELTLEERVAAVSALDAEAFPDGSPSIGMAFSAAGSGSAPGAQPAAMQYRALKVLIAQAYYASEAGSTKELQYELVPGRWIGDAPVSEIGRTWAE